MSLGNVRFSDSPLSLEGEGWGEGENAKNLNSLTYLPLQEGEEFVIPAVFAMKIPLNPPLIKGEALLSPLWQRGKGGFHLMRVSTGVLMTFKPESRFFVGVDSGLKTAGMTRKRIFRQPLGH